jgi:hypothetical protein
MSEKSLKGHAERTGVDLLPASEGLTSQRAERGEDGRRADRPRAIVRRAVLHRGAKLVYEGPAVLAVMRAKPVGSFPPSWG